jgi:murein DD-endopeptidase MepM/ murein hydrolase activator NlpD
MKKRTIAFLLFFLVSAMPIERPKTIEIDTENLQRYNEQYGTWENNNFILSETEEDKPKNKIIFNEEEKYLFPLENKKINDRFGISSSRYHLGVDYDAKIGQIILASKSGEVIETGYRDNLGYYITIEYSNYIRFTYAHLSKIYVRNCDYVEIGQVIGRVGISGKSTGPHLHLEITYQNIYMNHNLIFD